MSKKKKKKTRADRVPSRRAKFGKLSDRAKAIIARTKAWRIERDNLIASVDDD